MREDPIEGRGTLQSSYRRFVSESNPELGDQAGKDLIRAIFRVDSITEDPEFREQLTVLNELRCAARPPERQPRAKCPPYLAPLKVVCGWRASGSVGIPARLRAKAASSR